MSPDERDDMDDELIREYLEGESSVSRLYRRHADAEPGPELDARIREAAQRAVSGERKRVRGPFTGHWMVPASLAAVLVLSVSIVLMMPEPQIAPTREPESLAPEPAGKAESRALDALEEDAGEPAGGGRLESREAAKRRAEPQRVPEPMHEAEPAAPAEQAPPAAPMPRAADRTEPAPVRLRESRPLTGATSGGAARLPEDEGLLLDPQAWLRHMEGLVDAGDEPQALANLRAFRRHYPNHPLPESLAPLARTLDSERP